LTTSLIFTAANLNSIDEMSIERHLEGSQFNTKTLTPKISTPEIILHPSWTKMICWK